ncbi:MAG TPA: hypothetical protein DCY20_00735 [Firmicutes bacterium]|nr:hypothetical protein [Bacillota bacterium]
MGINCHANDCVHNSQGACFAGNIVVDGKQATSTSGTNCKSYSKSSANDDFEFAAEFDANAVPTQTRGIRCKACNCKHNIKKSCQAEAVQINAANASCETFSKGE